MKRLDARGFRNLAPLGLEPGEGTHLILGDNGAGKTSLLEAIYLLATTRSFRTTQIADCRRHDENAFHLAGEVEGGDGARTRLEVALTPPAQGRSPERSRTVNHRRTSLAEHLAVLPIIAWTSADTENLTGAPALRRRFLDRGILGLQPTALAGIARYRQALAEKRKLLQREIRGEELSTWNLVLADAAADLIRRRAAYVERLATALTELLTESRLGLPEITLSYRPSPRLGADGAAAVLEEIEAAGERERRLQQAVVGPHRDDLLVRWQGHEIRRVASAGERKALGLALLAAHGRVLEAAGHTPIYLLDDVDTELDRKRLGALWEVFAEARQVLATSNRPWVWKEIETSRRWSCRDGAVLTTA